jgi:hypothetical protein
MVALIVPVLVLSAAGALLLMLGLRLARRRTPLQSALLVALTLLLLGVHVLYVFDKLILAKWLPFADCVFYANLSIPLAGLVIGLAWPVLKLPPWRKLAVLLFIALLGLRHSYAPYLGARPAMAAATWNGEICKQTTLSTCVPAACATLLRKAGIAAEERELAELCFTFESGSSSLVAFRALKLKTAGTPYDAVAFVGSADELRQQDFIGGVMSIKLAGDVSPLLTGAHEVMIWSFEPGGRVWIADPLSGNRLPWTREEFNRNWPGEGIFLRRRI